MKTKAEIKKRLCRVEQDERINYPRATIVENAPLALIQLWLETERDLLKWVLS